MKLAIGDATVFDALDVAAEGAYQTRGDTNLAIGWASQLIFVLLGILGAAGIGIVIWAGYTWMTSMGDPKKIEMAKKWLRQAVIGLVLISMAYVIVNYVFSISVTPRFMGPDWTNPRN